MSLTQTTAQQRTLFVRAGASGDGSSWAAALGSLSEALQQAHRGDQIWVAEGTYRPGHERTATFHIPAGVAVYGGFAGTENALDQRNPDAHPTILSGEIGQPGIEDNVYSVVTIGAADADTRLDGFVIAHGNAFDKGDDGDPHRCGGGLYVDGSKGAARPVIAHCVFRNNTARVGGAVYLNGRRGTCEPLFVHCRFEGNKAGVDGGAVFTDARDGGSAKPVFRFCHFEENEATYGGALVNAAGNGECMVTAEQTAFHHNMALAKGGAIYDVNASRRCRTQLTDCIFERNLPDDHSEVFMGYSSMNRQLYRLDRGKE
ncbi:MAG: hypothetical protein D6818_06160 [Bacteroidetes bacterium]|nr:MAG: hypothetical protein D6818_06160 [Bacteroidota bacterium]